MATLVDFNTHGTPTDISPGVTVGNEVTADLDCVLSACRVYLHDAGSGTVTVRVWSAGGSELASGSITQTFTAGQQYDVPLTTGVDLTAATAYVISAYSPDRSIGASPSEGTANHTHVGDGFTFTWADSALVSGDAFPTTDYTRCLIISPLVDPAPTAITVALTPATETDSTQALGRTKRKAIAAVAETDTAPVVNRQKSKAIEPALEADTAPTIEASGIRVAIATVTETDEAPAITRVDPATFLYRLTFPTYPRSFQTVPIGQTARFVLDQAVSIVRQGGTLRQFRSPSQTMLEAAGTEGRDWFIGGRIYEQIPNDVAIELRLAGFEAERVA